MKRSRSFLIISPALLVAVLAVSPGARAADCDERYYSPGDAGNEFPLRRPHKDFAHSVRAARAGGAVDKRNLAILYDAGAMVSRCPEKAAYWYRQAAAGGDDYAQRWLEKHEEFEQMRRGPECSESACRGVGGGGKTSASFVADARGHYFAPVTINGVTEIGMIDTGATTVAMSAESAKKFGLAYESGKVGMAETAAGKISNHQLTVPQISVGGIKLQAVPVSVGVQGQMLIGMSVLKRLNMQLNGGTLTLTK